MNKAFSNTEKERVKKKLKEVAFSCIQQYGVRKTPIDELVRLTGISKGSFYTFYASKEVLFFDVINDYHQAIDKEVVAMVAELPQTPGPEDFANLLFCTYKKMDDSFLLRLMTDGSLEYLMRKLPDEVVIAHQQNDDATLKMVVSRISFVSQDSIPVFSAGLRAIFLTLLHKREIGVDLYDDVLKGMLLGICQQYIQKKR